MNFMVKEDTKRGIKMDKKKKELSAKNANGLNVNLFKDVQHIIEDGRNNVAVAINVGLTTTYWNIGKRINEDILQNKRAEYGKEVIASLSKQLTKDNGSGWSVKQLQHCIHFVDVFPDFQIVSALRRQLTWTHFKTIIYLKTDLQRDFYSQMSRIERWSTRTLQKKIDGMLFERTAISKRPDQLAKMELEELREEDKLSPDLVFKDHYFLEFANLKDSYSENDLESAIVKNIELFLLELGVGFSFLARQKVMRIGKSDFKLDLLFYHRKLKRLVAIELKLGEFKPAYKGQMELYLHWLEKYEMEVGEEKPIGLILCAEADQEQVELMQLDKENIKVAEYITKYLPNELLIKKLHQFTKSAKALIEHRSDDIKIRDK